MPIGRARPEHPPGRDHPMPPHFVAPRMIDVSRIEPDHDQSMPGPVAAGRRRLRPAQAPPRPPPSHCAWWRLGRSGMRGVAWVSVRSLVRISARGSGDPECKDRVLPYWRDTPEGQGGGRGRGFRLVGCCTDPEVGHSPTEGGTRQCWHQLSSTLAPPPLRYFLSLHKRRRGLVPQVKPPSAQASQSWGR